VALGPRQEGGRRRQSLLQNLTFEGLGFEMSVEILLEDFCLSCSWTSGCKYINYSKTNPTANVQVLVRLSREGGHNRELFEL